MENLFIICKNLYYLILQKFVKMDHRKKLLLILKIQIKKNSKAIIKN